MWEDSRPGRLISHQGSPEIQPLVYPLYSGEGLS